jgi:prevent-host-death family protein
MSSEARAQFDIDDAKANLYRIIERVKRGEEIIISRAGTPWQRSFP